MSDDPPGSTGGLSPYRFSLGAGYYNLDLGNGLSPMGGAGLEMRMGRTFAIDERNSFFLQGLFRLSHLLGERSLYSPPSYLTLGHLGVEAGYQVQIAPRIFSAFFTLGLGANHFHSEYIGNGSDPPVRFDNAAAFALSLGGGISFWRGIFTLQGGIQPSFGLNAVGTEGAPGRGYNPFGYYFSMGIDIAGLVEAVSGPLGGPPSLREFWDGFQTPHVMLYGDYTFGANTPSGHGSHRQLEGRLTLYRPSDARSPLGFGLNMALGLGDGLQPGFARDTDHRGGYFEFEEAYLNLRLPWGHSTVIQGGKFYIGGMPLGTPNEISFLPVIIEDHESPNNNQISRGYQFEYAYPLSFGGVRLQTLLHPRVMLSLGTLHRWDSLFGGESGTAGIAGLHWHPTNFYTGSFTGLFGEDAGRPFTVLTGNSLFCIPSSVGCALMNTDSRLNIGASYAWGQMEGQHWHSLAAYYRLNFIPQVGISGRAEYFDDPTGVRTGVSQSLWGVTSTLHIQPVNWWQLRLEHRFDSSNASETHPDRPFSGGTRHQFGIGTAFTF